MRNAQFTSSVSVEPPYTRSREQSVLSGLAAPQSKGAAAASMSAYGKALAGQNKQSATGRMGAANLTNWAASQKARSNDLQNMYKLYSDAENNYSRRRTAARQLMAQRAMDESDIRNVYVNMVPNILQSVLSGLYS